MTVKIKIKGDGVSYEGETTASKAARIIDLLNAHEEVSPREVLFASKADSYPQKIAALGKYLSDQSGTGTFSLKELKKTFEEAGEPIPKNIGRDITAAIALGFVAPKGSRGVYHMTNLGLAHVKSKFPDARIRSRERIGELEIEPRLKGFPGYWHRSVKNNKSMRILWLLEFCNAHSAPELSTADIANLAERLGDEIKVNTIPSKMKGLMKKGCVVKTGEGRFKILEQGSESIRTIRGL